MDPNATITEKFTKKFCSKVIKYTIFSLKDWAKLCIELGLRPKEILSALEWKLFLRSYHLLYRSKIAVHSIFKWRKDIRSDPVGYSEMHTNLIDLHICISYIHVYVQWKSSKLIYLQHINSDRKRIGQL